jgi:hypothetical protein
VDRVRHAEALGKNLVVWIIDMPSDPRLHREQIARIAGERIRAWNGSPMERGPVGQFIASKQKMNGFPDADVIFGDFNIRAGPARCGTSLAMRPDRSRPSGL